MARTGVSGITTAWAGTPPALPKRTEITATAAAVNPPLNAMRRIAAPSTGPSTRYDTFVTAATVEQEREPDQDHRLPAPRLAAH